MKDVKGLSWINFLLGIWLIVSPFALLYRGISEALWDNVIVGVCVAVLAVWRAVARETEDLAGVSWIMALLGLWTLVSPFLLGYSRMREAMWNDVVVGIVIGVLAIYRASTTAFMQPAHRH